MWRLAFLALITGVAGCMGPLVDDVYQDSDSQTLLLEAGTNVPSLHDDPILDARVDDNDGVDRYVERVGAFTEGEHVRYWDFGPAPATAAPVWVIGTDDGSGGIAKLDDHPVLFDVVPGDPAYTPIWQVYTVFVTDSYEGQLITSPAALDEAVSLGLVQEPVAVPMYVNCPVVHPDVLLEVDDGGEPRAPSVAFYRGMRCYYFDFAPAQVPQEPYEVFPTQNLYSLRREGQEPLSEPQRNVDITGDEDLLDTNHVFEYSATNDAYTPLVRIVETVIPSDAGSIDTYLDETQADYTNADQLFESTAGGIVPVPGEVVAYEIFDEILNWPQQLAEGDN